jgi:hypothetical protein
MKGERPESDEPIALSGKFERTWYPTDTNLPPFSISETGSPAEEDLIMSAQDSCISELTNRMQKDHYDE